MTTDQARLELQEVPLRSGRVENLIGIDTDLLENDGQLIHQCDVQVALGILDHFASLGGPDAGATMHAGLHDTLVQTRNLLERLGRVSRYHLHHVGQHVLPIARVDAFRAVGNEEIALPLQVREALRRRNANLFGGARVDSAFEDVDGSLLHVGRCFAPLFYITKRYRL
jgi:hypothetical protein